MPPKDAGATTWTPEVREKFLMEIIKRAEVTVPAGMFKEIADEWGTPHTQGSLSKKFSRMKQEIAKAEGGESPAKRKASEAPTPETPSKAKKTKKTAVKKESSVEVTGGASAETTPGL